MVTLLIDAPWPVKNADAGETWRPWEVGADGGALCYLAAADRQALDSWVAHYRVEHVAALDNDARGSRWRPPVVRAFQDTIGFPEDDTCAYYSWLFLLDPRRRELVRAYPPDRRYEDVGKQRAQALSDLDALLGGTP